MAKIIDDPDKISVEIKPFDMAHNWKYIMATLLAASKVQMPQGSFHIISEELDVNLHQQYPFAAERINIRFDIPTFAPNKCFADMVKEEFLKLEMLSDKAISKKVYVDIFYKTLNAK